MVRVGDALDPLCCPGACYAVAWSVGKHQPQPIQQFLWHASCRPVSRVLAGFRAPGRVLHRVLVVLWVLLQLFVTDGTLLVGCMCNISHDATAWLWYAQKASTWLALVVLPNRRGIVGKHQATSGPQRYLDISSAAQPECRIGTLGVGVTFQ
jgi:hypothetical protein